MSYKESISKLYKAAMDGDVDTFNSLIQKDPLILNKVSLTPFSETPLHISALLGHLDFTIAILEKNPRMVLECDYLKRIPLHYAAAEGHANIVKALLIKAKANINNVCLARDEDVRTPLHLAAMRGRVEVIQELVSACPDNTISEMQDRDGDSVLHLCVRYNHLEALKLLVSMVEKDKLMMIRNQDGNTILHLAVILKQSESVRYLLSMPQVRAGANITNGKGFTALDMLEQSPNDYKSLEIRVMLTEEAAAATNEKVLCTSSFASPSALKSIHLEIGNNNLSHDGSQRNASKFSLWFKNLMKQAADQNLWIEDTRGNVLTAATLIATMTFQAAVNPPGGVWQQRYTDITGGEDCTIDNPCNAGEAVWGNALPFQYGCFLVFNSIAFMSSISVILMVLIGFPRQNNKWSLWLATTVMIVTLTFMTVTYISAMDLVTTASIFKTVVAIESVSGILWGVLVGGISFVLAVQFIVWSVELIKKKYPMIFGQLNNGFSIIQAIVNCQQRDYHNSN